LQLSDITGPGVPLQYRSAIFYCDPEQKRIAAQGISFSYKKRDGAKEFPEKLCGQGSVVGAVRKVLLQIRNLKHLRDLACTFYPGSSTLFSHSVLLAFDYRPLAPMPKTPRNYCLFPVFCSRQPDAIQDYIWIVWKVNKYKELQKHETNLAPRFRETMLVNIGTAFLMPTSRIKPALKVANKPPAKNAEATVRLAKPQGHSIRKKAGQDAVKASSTAKNNAVAKKPTRARRRAGPSQKAAGGIYQLDLSAFFPESVTQREKWICLACVLDVFTRHMGLARTTAQIEIKRYAPPLAEMNAPETTRPYFIAQAPKDTCPYCGSPSKWHAKLSIYRIEGGKATDTARRELVKSLPKLGNEFVVLEEKATQQHAFFEWLEKVSAGLDFDNPSWLREIARHYLSRTEPKVDWSVKFEQIHAIRRSRRLESGWEVDSGRLFLAPVLFDELLLVHYLVSRSQKASGLTLEGRYTLTELFLRLRKPGYLRAVGVDTHNPADALEQLLLKPA